LRHFRAGKTGRLLQSFVTMLVSRISHRVLAAKAMGVLMSIQLTILIIYLVLLIGIAWYAKRLSAGGGVQFLFAGRSMGAPIVAVSIAGIAIGGVSTIGVAENLSMES
jgi:hypothetical protein